MAEAEYEQECETENAGLPARQVSRVSMHDMIVPEERQRNFEDDAKQRIGWSITNELYHLRGIQKEI